MTDPLAENRTSKYRLTFSLLALLLFVTIICVFLVVPGGRILLGYSFLWIVGVTLVIGLLLLFQYPIFLLLGLSRITKSKTGTPQDVPADDDDSRT